MFESEKSWSDKFTPEIIQKCGPSVLRVGTIQEDCEELGDLTVKLNETNIGCRIRRYDAWVKYRDQFTIRSKSQYGQRTEIDKILEGKGQLFFYGFASAEASEDSYQPNYSECPCCGGTEARGLIQWFIGDLDVFRDVVTRRPDLLNNTKSNTDGTGLLPFRLLNFPQEFLVDGNTALLTRLAEIRANMITRNHR